MNILIDYLFYAVFAIVGLLAGWLLGRRNRPASDNPLTFEEAMRRWRSITQAAEGALLDNIAATTPWLAPALPAAIAYGNMVNHLGFDEWLAFVGALVIEFLGLAAVHTAFQLWEFNETKNDSETEAPFGWAVGAGAFYLFIIIVVNIILETAVAIGVWLEAAQITGKALLSLLSVVAAFVLALRSQHARRLAVKEQVKQERRDAYELGRLRKLVGDLETAVADLEDRLKTEKETAAALEVSNIALVENAEKLQAENDRLQERFTKLQTVAAKVSIQNIESNHSQNGSSATGYTDWRKIPQEVKVTFADMTPEKILEDNPEIVSKTAENWIKLSRKLRQKLSKEKGEVWGTW
jgi:regulator of replication initiation timing